MSRKNEVLEDKFASDAVRFGGGDSGLPMTKAQAAA
jgi:hypothetical protein